MGATPSLTVPDWIRRGTLRWVWALWEPLNFYRRSPHLAAYAPGNALWTADWYRRMHSREMVEKLAGMGINCVSTHYFKGFGVVAEAEQMALAARFTDLCHEHGIRVLGYHQWATICYETFLDEVPEAEGWIQRDAGGKLLLYSGSTYWRWLGCQQHDDYVAYLEAVVRRCLTEARMDGIEWDGTVYKCHCALCQQRFREYLTGKYAAADPVELFGLPHFRHVRIPTTESRRDPLYLELLDFRRDFMLGRLRAFNALIKSLNPEAAQVTYCVDPAPDAPLDGIDIIVDENHNFPFVADGVLTTKMRGLKHGHALDRVVLTTCWLRAPSVREPRPPGRSEDEAELAAFGIRAGGLRRPETPAEVKRDLAETAMYGGHLITPTWALRSVGGDRAAFEDPLLEPPLRAYLRFFADHEPLYDVERSLANVAILRARASLAYDFFSSFPAVTGMEQVCLQHQLPFDHVFSHQLERLEGYDAVVLAEQTCLCDRDIGLLLDLVEGGGGLVLTGRSGLYDERFRPRRAHPFAAVLDHPRVCFLPDAPERLSTPQRDHPPAYHDFHLPERSQEIAAAIVQAAGRLPYRVEGSRFLGTDGYRLRSGERVIHLLNYANEAPCRDITVTLPEDCRAAELRLLSPDQNPVEQSVSSWDGQVVVKTLDTYALLVLPATVTL